MHTVVETWLFTPRTEVLLAADERVELINFLAANPLAGDLIKGSGGDQGGQDKEQADD